MSMVRRSDGHHNCYDHYELRSDDNLFNCDGCKTKGHGDRYRCNLCRHELHIDCRNPRINTTHEFFPGSTFTFREEPLTRLDKNNRREYSKCCNACGKDICGFSYTGDDNLDLHPCCRNLQKTLFINGTVFNLQAESSKMCIWCKKRKIRTGSKDVPGWSYLSTCDKRYHFHVFCMTEMVQEACMKNNGESVELGKLARRSGSGSGSGYNKMFETIKAVLKRYHFHVFCMTEMVQEACMKNNGESVELGKLARRSGSGSGSGYNKMFETIKAVLKIVLAALLGDPTLLISNVFVELVSRGLE